MHKKTLALTVCESAEMKWISNDALCSPSHCSSLALKPPPNPQKNVLVRVILGE